MLIAQAQIEGLALLTSDPVFARYDVSLLAV
jgi:PIN domain nuclease of toxin-antitoxin system